MKILSKRFAHTISFASIVLFCLVISGVNTKAQTTQSGQPARGTGGPGTQASTEIDNINLQNGNVSLQIPLASLAPVRGGNLSYTLTASYNSSLWASSHGEGRGDNGTGCGQIYSASTLHRADGGGWRIGGQYQVELRDAHFSYDYTYPLSTACDGGEYYELQGRFFKPVLTMPDGSEHEMRILGSFSTYGGNRDYLQNYYKDVSPNGRPFATTTRLYTVDGTFIVADYNSDNTYTIYLEDGTKIQTAGPGQQRITDPNGNSILVSPNSVKDEYTDREIKWNADTYEGQEATKIEYQSFGGAWQSAWLVWGRTHVYGRVYRTTAWDPSRLPAGRTCTQHTEIEEDPGDVKVLKEIVLPSTESSGSSRKYIFAYNSDTKSATVSNTGVIWNCVGSSGPPTTYTRSVSGMGEVSSIITPSGAEIRYHYSLDPVASSGLGVAADSDGLAINPVVKKEVLHDGVADTWNYNIQVGFNASNTSFVGPDGSTYAEMFYPTDVLRPWLSDLNGFGGLTYRSVQSGRVMTEKIWSLKGGPLCAFGSGGFCKKVTYNPVVDIEYTSLLDTSGNRVLMSAKKFTYDYNGELKTTTEYDWFSPGEVNFSADAYQLPTGIPTSANILRVVDNSFYSEAAAESDGTAYHRRWMSSSPVILGKLKETKIGNGGTTPKSHTQYSYDGQPFGYAPTVGNLTKASAWDDVTSSWINTQTGYDSHGNVTSMTDAKGYVTQLTYGAVQGPNGAVYDLYPTQTVQAQGTSVARTSAVEYDFYTGLPKLSTDVDNNVSVATVYDILGRPTVVENAVGTPLESWTETEYSDSNRRVIVRSDIGALHDKRRVATQFFDQLGRVRLSKTLENAATQSAENETDGIKVETKYYVENGYTYQVTSNPFRAATSSQGTNEPTMGWTRSKLWSDGRKSQVETFSGPSLPAPWGSNTTSTGVVTTDIDANATTVTDQAGKLRRSITNAIGQLKRVDEPTSAGLGAVATPNQPTSYSYDVLNNLLTVTQLGTGIEQCGPLGGSCAQTRNFVYSSLSRLKSATNPESGTINYVYDPNGNLTSKKDARGVQTDYVYDELNRLKNRNYSTPDGTPTNYEATPNVTYAYGTAAPAIGKLTKVTNGTGANLSTTEYVSFDILGRVTRSIQTTDGITYGGGTDQTKWMTYSYNLSGALTEQQYPSGRVVKNVIDSDGELATVQSKKNASHAFWNFANHFAYNAAGAVTSMQLGNGRWESTKFNERLQPTQIALGRTAPTVDTQGQPVYSSELLKLNYEYGELYPGSGNTDFSKDNGNVSKQTITVGSVGATPGFEATQYYAYDSLNRIQVATENIVPTGGFEEPSWRQSFSYDRYGNRNFVTTGETPTTTLGTCPVDVCNPTISPNNNKITSTGYNFDAAGNTTRNPQDRKFTYDAENKQTKVETVVKVNGNDVLTGTMGEYWYDGDGRRIKKRAYDDNQLTEETIFVYDALGKLVGEYSNQVASSQAAALAYLTNDHLGSPRVNTDVNGNVTARHDYHPFGEDLSNSKRLPPLGYAVDAVRKQFTGYERDAETDLNFAQARYHNFNLGRFNSPDPLMASQKAGNPQTANRYVYVGNNPINIVDPLGLDWIRSNERDDNGQYTYHDVYGKELKKYLKSGDYSRVDFGGADSHIIERAGVAIYEMFAKGGGREIPTPTTPVTDPATALVDSFAEVAPQKAATVGLVAGAGVAIGTGAGFVMAGTGVAAGTGITTLGLSESGGAAGTAVINGNFLGQSAHLSIRVSQGSERVATQLVENSGTAVVRDAMVVRNPVFTSQNISLPNAQAAMQFQNNLLNGAQAAGRYGLANNCVTHCASVLRAGGVGTVRSTYIAYRSYFQTLLGR